MVSIRLTLALVAAAAAAAASVRPQSPPRWLKFEHRGAWVAGRGYESTPMFFDGKLYLMQSMMGSFAPDGRAHSYFCIFDGVTGEEVACPPSSSGHAACAGVVDRTSRPGTETAYVFCSAWDRANRTCPEYAPAAQCRRTCRGGTTTRARAP